VDVSNPYTRNSSNIWFSLSNKSNLGQTYTPLHPNIIAVELWFYIQELAPIGIHDITVGIKDSPGGILLAPPVTMDLFVGPKSSMRGTRFVFPNLIGGSSLPPSVFIDISCCQTRLQNESISVASMIDSYPGGSAWWNGQSQVADLAFITYYDFGYKNTLPSMPVHPTRVFPTFPPQVLPASSRSSRSIMFIVGFICFGLGVTIIVVVVIILLRRRRALQQGYNRVDMNAQPMWQFPVVYSTQI